jgi:cytochrome c-type biogenesis protein
VLIQLFTKLSNAIQSTPLIALTASFIWGILSVLLSPCHLSSIPLIVGFINDQEEKSTKRAFWLSTLFSLGILITIALIGVITSLMGRLMGDIGNWANYLVAVILILIGIYMFDIIPLNINAPDVTYQKKGFWAALVLGVVFGVALGPCTFAFMAPMIGVAFTVASTNFIYAASLLLFYGIGHCLVIIIFGTSIQLTKKYLDWDRNSKGTIIIKKICGVLLILGGTYLIWTAI